LEINVFGKEEGDYDNIVDLCYSWLYSRLHFIIAKHVIKIYNPEIVLDIGCGTGFQSFLYASSGSSVVGIDISEIMIKSAMIKRKSNYMNDKLIPFPENFGFVTRYNNLINSEIRQSFRRQQFSPPTFLVCDGQRLPFEDEYFSHVNSCGSVLSLVENSHLALTELTRVLKPGGTLFIEVESKWNMDRIWTLFDVLLRNKLGYWASFREAFHPFSSITQCISINYPYGERGKPVNMRIRLFTNHFLRQEFSALNLKVIKRWALLSITNLIPSPILDTSRPGTFLKNLFTALSVLEEKIPYPIPGCTSAYLLQKSMGE
jgi:ubiquinone/menaquinone biosynthesis C-methylase UbiE